MKISSISLLMLSRTPLSLTALGEPHLHDKCCHDNYIKVLFPHTRIFSTSETLSVESKYYCEECCSKQEATKRLRVKKLPQILALHLKRFKYMEHSHRYTKLSYRVVFPWELKLFNTVCELTIFPGDNIVSSFLSLSLPFSLFRVMMLILLIVCMI